MPESLRPHFQQHPPGTCVVCLEHSVAFLNVAVLTASIALSAYAAKEVQDNMQAGAVVPWYLWCVVALGLSTAAASLLAVLGACCRSLALINTYIVLEALLMSAQLCLTVALVLMADKSAADNAPHSAPFPAQHPHLQPQHQLSSLLLGLPSRKLFLHSSSAGYVASTTAAEAASLVAGPTAAVAPADAGGGLPVGRDDLVVGVNLHKLAWLIAFGVEALTLALTCMLQSVYQMAQEVMDDYAADEAAWEGRQPLMHRVGPGDVPGGSGPSTSGGTSSSPPPPGDEWSAHMRERYGLDTSQFTYRPQEHGTGAQQGRRQGRAGGQGGAQGQGQGAPAAGSGGARGSESRGACAIM